MNIPDSVIFHGPKEITEFYKLRKFAEIIVVNFVLSEEGQIMVEETIPRKKNPDDWLPEIEFEMIQRLFRKAMGRAMARWKTVSIHSMQYVEQKFLGFLKEEFPAYTFQVRCNSATNSPINVMGGYMTVIVHVFDKRQAYPIEVGITDKYELGKDYNA